MLDRVRTRLIGGVLAFLAAAVFYLATPEQPQAQAAHCNGTGRLCWQNESCASIIFYKQCTTIYKYYPAGGSGGGSGSSSGGKTPRPGGGTDCNWGSGYLGWKPNRCD